MSSSRRNLEGVLVHYHRHCDWCSGKFVEYENKSVLDAGFHFCSKKCMAKMKNFRIGVKQK